jgi:hypothetical protein
MRIVDCGFMSLFDADVKWRLKTASIRNPQSAFRIPSGPGIVIALKISHCVHIVSGLGGGAEPCGWS